MSMKQSMAIILGAVLLAPNMALAAPQCFQVFSGVYLRFEEPVTDAAVARNGRVWGGLSPCAGLSSWPVVGNSYRSRKDGLVVAFRSFNVDANTCGAVDWIGTMSGKPLSGPFQLFNQRTNFCKSGEVKGLSLRSGLAHVLQHVFASKSAKSEKQSWISHGHRKIAEVAANLIYMASNSGESYHSRGIGPTVPFHSAWESHTWG